MKNDGGPAFPTDIYYEERRVDVHSGMTLRDWFAGQTIVGAANDGLGQTDIDIRSSRAYRIADAMIKARKEQP